jgi:chemotaxis protein CheC
MTALSSTRYTQRQLDALRELAKVSSDNAASALSSLLVRGVEITEPSARVTAIPDAVAAFGAEMSAIVLGVFGDFGATVLLLIAPDHAEQLCGMLGLPPDSEFSESALMEVGNIVGASYVRALGSVTGTEIEPTPPSLHATVESALTAGGVALLLDSVLVVEAADCRISFVLIADHDAADVLLA